MTVGLFSVVEKRAEEERRDRDWAVVMEERCVVIGGRVLCGCNMKELMAGAAESRRAIIILIVACIDFRLPWRINYMQNEYGRPLP